MRICTTECKMMNVCKFNYFCKIFKIDLSVVMLTYGPPRTTPWQNICTQRVQSCQNNAFLFVQVSNTLLFLQCAKKKILKSLEYCCKCFAPKSSMCFIKMKLLHSEWRHRKISLRKLISARNGGNGLHHVSFRCMLSPSKLLFEHSHGRLFLIFILWQCMLKIIVSSRFKHYWGNCLKDIMHNCWISQSKKRYNTRYKSLEFVILFLGGHVYDWGFLAIISCRFGN